MLEFATLLSNGDDRRIWTRGGIGTQTGSERSCTAGAWAAGTLMWAPGQEAARAAGADARTRAGTTGRAGAGTGGGANSEARLDSKSRPERIIGWLSTGEGAML